MPNLYPVFEMPEIPNEETADTGYRESAFFDFEKGDFRTDAAGHFQRATGREAWIQWCQKAAATQRNAHMAYSHNFGIEAEEAFREPSRKAQEAAFEKTITEALLADPLKRTAYVRDFEFVWTSDELQISFTVGGLAGDTTTIAIAV